MGVFHFSCPQIERHNLIRLGTLNDDYLERPTDQGNLGPMANKKIMDNGLIQDCNYRRAITDNKDTYPV